MNDPAIVVVDDEAVVLDALAAGLRRRFGGDYRIIAEGSPSAALAALEERSQESGEVAVLIADDQMPEMPGLEFLARAHELHPRAKRVLLVDRDYRSTSPAVRAISFGQIDYHLTKPWFSERSLYLAVSEFLAEWASTQPPAFDVFRIVGPPSGPRVHAIRDFLARTGVPYRFHREDSNLGRELLREAGVEGSSAPVVIRYDGQVLVDPSLRELIETLGVSIRLGLEECDVAIVGAGPAGLAAAVCASSEGLSTVLLEREVSGGQAGTSSHILNYPGFPHGINGAYFADRTCEQAWLLGANLVFSQEVSGLTVRGLHRVVQLAADGEVSARAVVIATGVAWRRLGIPRLEALNGSGVYYGAAASEGQAVDGLDAFVVGAANSAGQAAIHLATHARRVTILARADSLAATMSQYLITQIEHTRNIEVRLGIEVVDGEGGERLEAITVRNRFDGRTEVLPAAALFVLIGGQPHTAWLGDDIARDDEGFILTGRELTRSGDIETRWSLERPPLQFETSVPGVFAAGDVRHGSVKRVASAVGEASATIYAVHEYLTELRS